MAGNDSIYLKSYFVRMRTGIRTSGSSNESYFERANRHLPTSLENIFTWAVFLLASQLLERSLQTPEVHGSNPVMGKNIERLLSTLLKRLTQRKKRPGMDI